MTVVFGNVKNIAGLPTEGFLWVSSPRWRPGGDAVVTMVREPYEIKNGAFETGDLLPGEILFEFSTSGSGQTRRKPYVFVVPESPARLNFVELLETQFEYPAEVVGEAQKAALAAQRWADAAEVAAARIGSAAKVEQWVSSVDADAKAAVAASNAASVSAAEAKDSEDKAKASQDAAKTSEGNAKASETVASSAAATATTKSGDASASAEAAKASEDKAKASEANAKTSETNSAGSASEASEARDSAQAYAGGAQTQAQVAQVQADRSKSEADRAALSALRAAETVSSGSPDATTDVKGKVRLAGDLAGTADAPTVPGLADKANASHTHAVADVNGLQEVLDDKPSKAAVQPTIDEVKAATYSATASTLMKRTSTGAVSVATPTAGAHAANKTYVDNAVAANPSAPHTHVIGDVTNLQAELDKRVVGKAATDPVMWGIVQYSENNTVRTASPVAGTDATNKGYTDYMVNQRLRTTEVESSAPTASKVPRRTGTGQLQSSADPEVPNDLARKSYVDSIIPPFAKQYFLYATSLKGAASTISRSASWGSSILGLEAPDPKNSTELNKNANFLTCRFDGTYKIVVSGWRGGGTGTVSCINQPASGGETEIGGWTEATYVEKVYTTSLASGDKICLRWSTNGSSNSFTYTVTMEMVG